MKYDFVPNHVRDPLHLLKPLHNLVGCEIGVENGYHSYRMLTELDIKKLYLVDPWTLTKQAWIVGPPKNDEELIEAYEVTQKALKMAHKILDPFGDKVTFLEMESYKASYHIPDNSLDFIYIDGDHTYEAVTTDLRLYYSKIKIGGMVSGHDYYHNPSNAAKRIGVAAKAAVDDFCKKHDIKNLRTKPGATWWWFVKGKVL